MRLTASLLATCLLIFPALPVILLAAESKFDHLKSQAEKGEPETLFLLGCAYMQADGTPQDYEKAAEVLRKAAEQGYAKAQTNLGYLYVKGLGVEKSPQKGADWYRRAAEQGELQAQHNLAQLFDTGTGVPKDFKRALQLHRKAAEKGHLQSQYQLGMLLRIGDENQANYDFMEAATWLQKAAARGMPEACNALGTMYEDGFGVAQDRKAAFECFEKAAVHGEPKAQANLGRCFALGLGTTRDVLQAYKWLKIADSRRELTATKTLVGVVMSMTPEQIASGDQLVAAFQPLPVQLTE